MRTSNGVVLKTAAGKGTPAKRGRPAAAESKNGSGKVAASIAAIKKLVDELGVEEVKAIAEVFRK